ncbi:MAG: hypothetical protein JWM85_2558 [Acidimicrobiaceae bacterium]|nr:hypothetical protein [Acidimicrobiaceae bacterium]
MAPRRAWGSAVLVSSVLAGSLLAACGGSPASTKGSITLYNGQHVQTTQALVSAFEKQTGITVNVRSGNENSLDDQIVAEGAHARADVIYTENSPALEYLQSRGLLAKADPSALAETPRQDDSPQGRWVAVSARVSVIVYNTRLLKAAQLPTSVLQLAEARWKGKLAFAPSETDFQPIVTAVDARLGSNATLSWLLGLKANAGSHLYPDNETVTSQVNSGQAAIGVIDQYYWYRMRAQLGARNMHSAIAYFAPRDPGYVLDVSGAGVLASSNNKPAAQRFLRFLASASAQRIIAEGDSFEYPLDSKVTTAKDETPLDLLKPDPLGVAQLGDGQLAISLLQKAQLL